MSIDQFGLPPTKNNVQIYTASGAVNNGGWRQWIKPRGVDMIMIVGFGAGGGGGSGFTAIPGTAKGGGGGGGSGAITRFVVPAILIPDILYVCVGIGGAPATSGGNSYVTCLPINNVPTAGKAISEAVGHRADFAIAQHLAGATATEAKAALADILKAENETLRNQIAGAEGSEPLALKGASNNASDHEATWANNVGGVQQTFLGKKDKFLAVAKWEAANKNKKRGS